MATLTLKMVGCDGGHKAAKVLNVRVLRLSVLVPWVHLRNGVIAD